MSTMNDSIMYSGRIDGFSSKGARELGARIAIADPIIYGRTPRPVAERTTPPQTAPAELQTEPSHRGRRLLFRCARLVLTGAVLAGVVVYARHTLTSARSEVAYINAEMVALRAPIEGELRLEREQLGELIPQGAPFFTVLNSRPGNQEVIAQLNGLRELTERLQAEAKEAAACVEHQEEAYKIHEKLYKEKLISRLAFLEEQSKLTLAQTTFANKKAQVYQAETRSREMEHQAELRKEATVPMPFEGVAWTISAKSGASISAYEPVAQVIDRQRLWVDAFFHEKHAPKLRAGLPVSIRALDGTASWQGHVESVRSGVGRIACGSAPAVSPAGFAPRRVAVRVRMDCASPYDASQFFGVGRSVVVTLNEHE